MVKFMHQLIWLVTSCGVVLVLQQSKLMINAYVSMKACLEDN